MKTFLKYSQVIFIAGLFVMQMVSFCIINQFSESFLSNINKTENIVESGASGLDFSVPVEALDVNENEYGYIVITTVEKSFVKAPIDCVVQIVEKDNMKGVKFEKFGYCCFALGFDVISIVDGMKVESGRVIGSLQSNKLYVKIYKNENRVSLKTIRNMFNV